MNTRKAPKGLPKWGPSRLMCYLRRSVPPAYSTTAAFHPHPKRDGGIAIAFFNVIQSPLDLAPDRARIWNLATRKRLGDAAGTAIAFPGIPFRLLIPEFIQRRPVTYAERHIVEVSTQCNRVDNHAAMDVMYPGNVSPRAMSMRLGLIDRGVRRHQERGCSEGSRQNNRIPGTVGLRRSRAKTTQNDRRNDREYCVF